MLKVEKGFFRMLHYVIWVKSIDASPVQGKLRGFKAVHCPTGSRVKFHSIEDWKIFGFIKKLLKHGPSHTAGLDEQQFTVIPRAEHGISRDAINPNALKVLYRLNRAGYEAYLVGGGVRDLLLGFKPKDFDVATNAHPEQIQALFRNCRLIGRRFRLAHIYFHDGVIEVATFRARHDLAEGDRHTTETGMILRDNIYGTLADDAWRRDFTINALYYNIANFSVIDYTEGMTDIKHHLIRMIGDPVQRYHEDPVRMLRAVRLAAKLNCSIEPATGAPINQLAGLLQNVPAARLFEEIVKIYLSGKAKASFELLRQYGLFAILFPQTEARLVGAEGEIYLKMLTAANDNADQRAAEGKSLNPAFLLAVLLWGPLQKVIQENLEAGIKPFPALIDAMEKVLHTQQHALNLPKRLTIIVKEIWILQYRIELRQSRRTLSIFYHQRFRAAYDYLLIRSQAGEPVQDLAEWWQKFQATDEEGQQGMLSELQRSQRHTRTRRKH